MNRVFIQRQEAEPAQPEQAEAELSAGAGTAEGEAAIGAAAEQDEEGNQEVGVQGTEGNCMTDMSCYNPVWHLKLDSFENVGNTGEESAPVPLKEDLAVEAEMGEGMAEAQTETEPALEGAKDEEGLSELAQEEEESSQAEAEAVGKAAGEKSSSATQESAPAVSLFMSATSYVQAIGCFIKSGCFVESGCFVKSGLKFIVKSESAYMP